MKRGARTDHLFGRDGFKRVGVWGLVLIAVTGMSLRMVKLDWGRGNFFHPDESAMAIAITKLSPTSLDPQLYTYGQLPIYVVYFFNRLVAPRESGDGYPGVTYANAVMGLRVMSAIASLVTVIVAFGMGRSLWGKKWGLATAAIVSFMPGLIQGAHFGTTETLLGLWMTLSMYCAIKMVNSGQMKPWVLGMGVATGLGLGTKISTLVVIPVGMIAIWWNGSNWFSKVRFILVYLILGASLGLATSPYWGIKFKTVWETINYERKVAAGKITPFYTRQFVDSKPVLFEMTRVWPWIAGWAVVGGVGIGTLTALAGKKRGEVLVATFVIWFGVFNLWQYVRWIRLWVPILPLWGVVAVGGARWIYIKRRMWGGGLTVLLILATVISGWGYFRVWRREDVRIRASKWIRDNVSGETKILTESGNTVDLPVNGDGYDVAAFDFYKYTDGKSEKSEDLAIDLAGELAIAEYVVVSSRRVWANYTRPTLPYKTIRKYYELLRSGGLGFERAEEFTSFPGIGSWNWNDELAAEETFSVFDHPKIVVYKKMERLTGDEYQRRLLNL